MVDYGRYAYHRKIQTPLKYHTRTCHFIHAQLRDVLPTTRFSDYGLLFDPRLRDVGDGEWMIRLLAAPGAHGGARADSRRSSPQSDQHEHR